METQLERKSELQSEIEKIDGGIAAAEGRLTLWRSKSEQAAREIGALSTQLEKLYALAASGEGSTSPDALEENLVESRRLETGARKLIEDETAKLGGLRGLRQPLVVELEQIERQQAIEQERAATEQMMEAAEGAFSEFDKAGRVFLEALGSLKTFPFIDEGNKNLAVQKWFSLQARIKGFRA